MSDIYNRIHGLCLDKGISVSKMCKELSITRSCLSELKSGRTETLSADNIYKIAKYFNVPVDFILCNTDSKEIVKQKAIIYFKDLKTDEKNKPLVNNDEELTDYLEELKNRKEMRMLFSVSKGSTKEEVEQAVRIIEALRKKEDD